MRQVGVRGVRFAIALIAAFSPLPVFAQAPAVRNVQSKIDRPIAPRGGVLMLPLTAERHGQNWPQTLDLQVAVGSAHQTLTGQVAWIYPAPPKYDRRWTDDPRELLIRAIQPEDDSRTIADDPVLGPYLLARLPADVESATLQLGRQSLRPDWTDVPGPFTTGEMGAAARGLAGQVFSPDASFFASDDELPTLTLAPSPDRPDPVSPFEYWRWVLLADRLELNPPLPFGGEIERMAAEHYAALWRIGLHRVAMQSLRVADQCRDLLTQTCIDRRQPFAAWVIDPVQVGALLARFLDSSRNESSVLANAVDWIDEQPPLTFWPEAESCGAQGDQVRLAMFTPRTEPVVVTFTWLNTDEPPLAVRIEPGVLMQVLLDRPPLPRPRAIGMPAPPEPQQQPLIVEADEHRYELVFGPRTIDAKPPGVFFRALSAPLTLAEAQARQQRIVADHRATLVHVRRLGGRWEVFVECRRRSRPDAEADLNNDMATRALPDVLTSLDDVRGFEAITILLGDEDAIGHHVPPHQQDTPDSAIWLTIPETGFWQLNRGANDGTLQIHRTSYEDRWLCRVVLPEAWFSAEQANPARIGFLRSHDDSTQLETGPNVCPPWRPAPSRITINLEHWDALPEVE